MSKPIEELMISRSPSFSLRLRFLFLLLGFLMVPAGAQAQVRSIEKGGCLDDVSGSTTCTSKDTKISRAFASEVLDGCVPDIPGDPQPDTATFILGVEVLSTATNRYDLGAFIPEDGVDAHRGECRIITFNHVNDSDPGPFPDVDSDVCGDIQDKVIEVQNVGKFTVPCRDDNGDGSLDIDACLSWDNNANTTCNGPQDVKAGTGSKCRCDVLQIAEIPIPCDDGNACNGVETRNPNTLKCIFGTPVDCSSLNDACIVGECDPTTGNCSAVPANEGGSCDDDLYCNGPDTCLEGSCTAHSGDPCASGGECANECNEETDSCTDLLDGDDCTPDVDDCTDNVCSGGECVAVDNTAFCDDDVFCNGPDTCFGGTCSVHAGDPCKVGDECNDLCNEEARNCAVPQGTSCVGIGDNEVCTDNECNGLGACVSVNNTKSCNDLLFCNGPDTCSGGTCSVHAGNPCSGECADECNEATDSCTDLLEDEPCTDEPNDCTRDQCDGLGNCEHKPLHDDPQTASGQARAYGVSLMALDGFVIPPTPNITTTGNYQQTEIPADPIVHVDLLTGAVDETGVNHPHSAATSSTATATDVFILDNEGNFIVSSTSVKVRSSSVADANGASSTWECVLEGVNVGGEDLGTVKSPVTKIVDLPGIGVRAEVHLCEVDREGAAAGVSQPDASGMTSSSAVLNGIRVAVMNDATDPLQPLLGTTTAEVVVSHAESDADFAKICQPGPQVSGEAFAVGVGTQGDVISDKVAHVILPSSGGEEKAELVHAGPIADETGFLIESISARTKTFGTTNPLVSMSSAEIEHLEGLASGSDPRTIVADAVKATCNAGATATGETTIASLSIGGTDIVAEFCGGSGNQAVCKPAPNTMIPPSASGLPVLIVLNEQFATTSGGKVEITVNAAHIYAIDNDSPFADIILSSVHCDAAPAPTAQPAIEADS